MQDHLIDKVQPHVAITSRPIDQAPATITLDQYLAFVRAAHDGVLPLNEEQKNAVAHDFATPLWMIAGPGTGKTHTLVWLVLKRMLVDGVLPDRIILTTFTRKAAAELESRLVLSRQKLMAAGCHEAETCDITRLHLGTLHSLCSQLLRDHHYEPAMHIRLLEDDRTQQFFIRRTHNPLASLDDLTFWIRLGVLRTGAKFSPNTARRTEAACAIFNRMTENAVDLDMMDASGDSHLHLLAAAYRDYEHALSEAYRTDQAHLQRHLLDFLATVEGKSWLGDGFTVVVDEYQDTNPIQEDLYFRLAGQRGDLAVVGDDDQSLYRFRGATVESLIDFDRACRIYLGRVPKPAYLHENRRSHPLIVDWVNRFIRYHPEMRDATVRVRAPNKPNLVARSAITDRYPAVMLISEGKNSTAATKMAEIIQALRKNDRVADYSQIVVLAFSVKENTFAIGAYTDALKQFGIPFYNPRSRTAQQDPRFQSLLGALSTILDPDFDVESLPRPLPDKVREYVGHVRKAYAETVADGQYPQLAHYVTQSIEAIRTQHLDPDRQIHFLEHAGGRRVTLNGLLYKLLAHEPFATYLTDLEGGERLKALNQTLSEYESLYNDGELQVETASESSRVRIARGTLYTFYAVFVEGIHDGLNDPEDDEISIQPGAVNIMTIHQAKGLEFEVVFVARPDKQPRLGETHILEDLLDPYIQRPTKPVRRSQELRVAEDAIRLFFVAYSRAKRLLVLTGSNVPKWERVLGVDSQGARLDTVAAIEKVGVHRL